MSLRQECVGTPIADEGVIQQIVNDALQMKLIGCDLAFVAIVTQRDHHALSVDLTALDVSVIAQLASLLPEGQRGRLVEGRSAEQPRAFEIDDARHLDGGAHVVQAISRRRIGTGVVDAGREQRLWLAQRLSLEQILLSHRHNDVVLLATLNHERHHRGIARDPVEDAVDFVEVAILIARRRESNRLALRRLEMLGRDVHRGCTRFAARVGQNVRHVILLIVIVLRSAERRRQHHVPLVDEYRPFIPGVGHLAERSTHIV